MNVMRLVIPKSYEVISARAQEKIIQNGKSTNLLDLLLESFNFVLQVLDGHILRLGFHLGVF